MSRNYVDSIETIEADFPKIQLYDDFDLTGLTVKNIIFRNMHLDSSYFIKCKHPHNITLMTYKIGAGFSKSVLKLIETSHSDLKLKIAFCLVNDSFNSDNQDTLSKLKDAFSELFVLNESVEIEIIANPQTHIKLLNCNDELFLGSMNFSKTADDIEESVEKKHKDNYRNHELLIHFEDKKDVTKSIWDKLKTSDGTISKKLNINNYDENLDHIFDECRQCTISSGKKIKEEIDSIEKHPLQMKVKDQVYRVIRHFLDNTLDISMYSEISEMESIFNHFLDEENHGSFIDDILELSKFLKIGSIDQELIRDLRGLLQDLVNYYLSELIFEQSEMEFKILEDRLDNDMDDGEEGLIFGERSEKERDKQISSNNDAIITFIDKMADDFSKYFTMYDLCETHKVNLL